MKKVAFLFLALFTFESFTASAQDSCSVCKPFPWEIGGILGVNQYFGEMHCSKPYASQNRLMGGVFVRKHINDYFAIRPQILVGQLGGRDLDRPDHRWDYRQLRFNTKTFVEAAVLGEYYPFKDRKYTCDGFSKKNLAPYLFAGVGVNYGNPNVSRIDHNHYNSSNMNVGMPASPVLQRDLDADAAALKKLSGVFPVGLGVKYNATRRFTVGAEAGYRFSTSDYLDGVSLAGNSNRKDGYFLANLLASYRFGDKDADKDGVVDKCDLCLNEAGLAKFQGCPDTDGDGTPDKTDACPTVAGPMGLMGCPDSDGDGIADKDDACPTLMGLTSLKGCPDKDFDGVADKDDACPTVAGVAALKGCPDTDGDGIADKDDACPNNAGPASLNGCPDADGDGIMDSKDDCVNVKGIAAANGCPDSDGDGIADNKDKCPTVPGLMSNGGCPEGYIGGVAPAVKGGKAGKGALLNAKTTSNLTSGATTTTPSNCKISASEVDQLNFASQNIEFYPGTNKLNPVSYKSLQRVCDVLARCPESKLTIHTYNDGGSDAQNVRSAKLRACAVYGYFLKKKCISKSRMNYTGFGDEDAKKAYTNAAGKTTGTRTEFILN